MLTDSVSPNDRYENLRNYITRARRPTEVSGFNQSARQPVALPTDALPGVKRPIPNSSSRPGKMTNQRIPYARISFNFKLLGNPYIDHQIQEGDISFVHRPTNSHGRNCIPGHGPNRASTIGNIVQINAMLNDHRPESRGEYTMSATNSNATNSKGEKIVPSKYGTLDTDIAWTERWSECKAIGRWTPDGVVIGSEHQHGSPFPLTGNTASNAGELWNICVQGPTPVKNVQVLDPVRSHETPNTDPGARGLDKVFIGLFAKTHYNNFGMAEFYSFQWIPLTSRQLLNGEITFDDEQTIVSVWKIGTVMDSRLTRERMQVNVCIEELELKWIIDEFDLPLPVPTANTIADDSLL